MSNETVNAMWVLVLVCALISCGGGVDVERPADRTASGIWTGTLSQEAAEPSRFLAFAHGGKIIGLGQGPRAVYAGNYLFNGQVINGAMAAMRPSGRAFGTASIFGTVSEESSLSGRFTGSAGNGSLALSYSPLTEKDSSLGLLNDVWSDTDGRFTRTLSVNADGTFTGSDTLGCVFNGAISIIDPDENLYDLQANVGNCPTSVTNGSYTGFATLDQRNARLAIIAYAPDALRIGAPSPAIVDRLARQ